jgi:hypothetical protein
MITLIIFEANACLWIMQWFDLIKGYLKIILEKNPLFLPVIEAAPSLQIAMQSFHFKFDSIYSLSIRKISSFVVLLDNSLQNRNSS